MRKSLRINFEDKLAPDTIARFFFDNKIKDTIFICIGTDRSTGDSLGPLVGSMLEAHNIPDVHGTIGNPVHAQNLSQVISTLDSSKPIVAIDAGLGKQSSVGYIDLKKGALKPGIGVDKDLGEVGSYSITGLVNVSGCLEYLVLQSTRLSLVTSMAQVIAEGIINYVKRKEITKYIAVSMWR